MIGAVAGGPVGAGVAGAAAGGVLTASGDDEHASLIRRNSVGMRNAFWRQQCLPSLGPTLLIPNAIADLTFRHVEDVVLVMLNVQGREVSP